MAESTRIKVCHLDFLGQGALLQPKDQELHDLAVDFCRREVNGEVNLAKLNNVWLAGLADRAGKIRKTLGICGWTFKVDIPLFRSLDSEVSMLMGKRINDNLADQGCRGNEVFLYLSSNEKPEQRCVQFAETIQAFEAKPADRWIIEVK